MKAFIYKERSQSFQNKSLTLESVKIYNYFQKDKSSAYFVDMFVLTLLNVLNINKQIKNNKLLKEYESSSIRSNIRRNRQQKNRIK